MTEAERQLITPKEMSEPSGMKFGPFRIDPELRTIDKQGEAIRLSGKAFQLLLVLIEKPREIVSRAEIRDRLWPQDCNIDYESNLNTLMNKLRTVLGETLEEPIYIETVLGEGYRWLVPPEVSAESDNKPKWTSSAVVSKPTSNSNRSFSNFWAIIGLIVLTLIGIGVGAEFARLWIARSARQNSLRSQILYQNAGRF